MVLSSLTLSSPTPIPPDEALFFGESFPVKWTLDPDVPVEFFLYVDISTNENSSFLKSLSTAENTTMVVIAKSTPGSSMPCVLQAFAGASADGLLLSASPSFIVNSGGDRQPQPQVSNEPESILRLASQPLIPPRTSALTTTQASRPVGPSAAPSSKDVSQSTHDGPINGGVLEAVDFLALLSTGAFVHRRRQRTHHQITSIKAFVDISPPVIQKEKVFKEIGTAHAERQRIQSDIDRYSTKREDSESGDDKITNVDSNVELHWKNQVEALNDRIAELEAQMGQLHDDVGEVAPPAYNTLVEDQRRT